MKIKVITDKNHDKKSITIITNEMTPEIQNIIDEVSGQNIQGAYRGSDILLNPKDLLFFETDQNTLYAHDEDKAYETRYRLYELEEHLPHYFIRISKSSIVNIKEISAIEKSITSSRKISFFKSQKTLYVSRKYYPILKEKLNERSL